MSDKIESQMGESISKLMRQSQNWPKNRWKHLVVGLICFTLGLYMIFSSVPNLFSNISLLDKIQIEKKPEELSTELWLIAEVRRSVIYQEKQNQLVALSLIECVIGIMMGFGACFMLVPLIMNWKDGGKEIQVIRLLLACHEELGVTVPVTERED
jgi:hypothetical protein